MQHYRITRSRWDVPTSVYKEFEAENDKEAQRIFQEFAQKQENAWDAMMLFRIDQKEIKTYIDSARLSWSIHQIV